MSTSQGPNGNWRYPSPGQPIPPPAPGPTSPLSAIFARSATFVLMGLTATWAFFLFTGVLLRSTMPGLSETSGLEEALPDPILALAGCGCGFLIWVIGLASAWRRPALWIWTGVGAFAVAGTTVWNLLSFLG